MAIGRDRLAKAETVTVAAIESGVELLVEAREIVADFQAMIPRRALAELDPWIERANTKSRCGIRERHHEGQSRGKRRDLLWLV